MILGAKFPNGRCTPPGENIVDELIIRVLRGTASDEEIRHVRVNNERSPDHAARFQELKTVWKLAEMLPDPSIPTHAPPVEHFLRQGPAEHMSRRLRGLAQLRAAAVAAGLLLTGTAVGLAVSWLGIFGDLGASLATTEFVTGPGEMVSASLPDGSVVRLGPGTRLEASFGPQSRDLKLDGRAFFSVRPDNDRPFTVETPGGIARVLGTRFELNARSGSLSVLVVGGRVAVTPRDTEAEMELDAGDLGTVIPGEELTIQRVESPEALLDWLGAFVAFEATPLVQVARELEARMGLRIVIEDEALKERTVTGWFGEGDRGQVLAIICRVASVHCEHRGDVVYMRQ
jgi:transmembrane sensor